MGNEHGTRMTEMSRSFRIKRLGDFATYHDRTYLTDHTQRISGTSLPFRTSPTVKHTRLFSSLRRNAPQPLFTQTITPTDSDEEASPQILAPSNPRPQTPPTQHISGPGTLDDTEMQLGSPRQTYVQQIPNMDAMMLSPAASPFTILPSESAKSSAGDPAATGRLPTPIYGYFQSATELNGGVQREQQGASQVDGEYEKHMRARRLPTPISEDEAMDSFETPEEDMAESPSTQQRQPARFPPPLPSQAGKRGKMMFSMGFRADCNLCQSRAPNHYNHIFWT